MGFPTTFPKVRQTRVTAGVTWAFRGYGGCISRVTFTSTADATCILSNKDDSAEGSRIAEVTISAGGSNPRQIVLLENHAGDLFVHTLTAKALVHIQYD
jgi:hypothetical protein